LPTVAPPLTLSTMKILQWKNFLEMTIMINQQSTAREIGQGGVFVIACHHATVYALDACQFAANLASLLSLCWLSCCAAFLSFFCAVLHWLVVACSVAHLCCASLFWLIVLFTPSLASSCRCHQRDPLSPYALLQTRCVLHPTPLVHPLVFLLHRLIVA
jgi:hypothetical protein